MPAALGKRIGSIAFGVTMDTSSLQRSALQARATIGSFAGSATRMLGVFGGGAGVSAVFIKAGASFEGLNRSMTRSLAIMGDVSKVMREDMTKAAIEVARNTKFSASQAADAYFYLASAGLNAEQSLAAMPQVAKFATAGNFDLALATDLLTDAQSALGLTVKDTIANMDNMTRVSDVLVKANTLANASVEQFSLALTTGAGAALKIVNKDVEEGVAVLAAFADQGVKAQEAGTAFGIVMRDLQTKAIQFPQAWKAAGIAVYDAAGQMSNMGDIIAGLEKRLIGLSDKGKKSLLLDLGFSDKSVKFVQSLLGTSDRIKAYEAALRSAGGTTEDIASKSLTPLEQAMNSLKGAFTEVAQAMGPVVQLAADITQKLADLTTASTATDLTQTGRKGGFKKGSLAELQFGTRLGAQDGLSIADQISGEIFNLTGGRLGNDAAQRAGPKGFEAQGKSTGFQGGGLGASIQRAYGALAEKFSDDLNAELQQQAPAKSGSKLGGLIGNALGGLSTAGNLLGNLGANAKEKDTASRAASKDAILGAVAAVRGYFPQIDAALNTAKNAGQLGLQGAAGALNASNGALFDLQFGKLGQAIAQGQLKQQQQAGPSSPASTTLNEAGSRAAYEQRVRGQSQGLDRVQLDQLAALRQIARNTTGPGLEAAGI
jgi:TP901 family phage tail tape measure protein